MSKSKLNRALLDADKHQQLLSKMKSSFWGVPEATITKGESRWDHSFTGATLAAWMVEYLEASESEILKAANILLETGNMKALCGKNKTKFQNDEEVIYCFNDVAAAISPTRSPADSAASETTPKKLTERVQKKNVPVRKMSKLFNRRPRSMTAASIGRSSRSSSSSVKDIFGKDVSSPSKKEAEQREVPVGRPKSLSMSASNFDDNREEHELIRRSAEASSHSSGSPAASPPPSARPTDMETLLMQTVSQMDILLLQSENESLKGVKVHLEGKLNEKREQLKENETLASVKAAEVREKRIAELIKRNGELEVANALLKEHAVAHESLEKRALELEQVVERLTTTIAELQLTQYSAQSLALRKADERDIRVHGKRRYDYEQLCRLLEPKGSIVDAVRERGFQPLFGEPLPGSVEARAALKSPRRSPRSMELSPRPGAEDAELGEGVVLAADKSLHSASVDGLIRYLVFRSSGTTDMHVVFLTYRSFLSPVGLLHRFLRAYATSRERKVWLRLVSILSTWQKSYPEDWLDSPQLAEVLEKFLAEIVTPTLSAGVATKLSKAVRPSALKARVTAACRIATDGHKVIPVDPELKLDSMSLMKLPATALAQQLVAVDYAMFSLVRTEDCFQQTWGQSDVTTSNLALLTQWFNDLSAYLSWRVMQEDDVNERALLVAKLVDVASYCRDVNALHTMMGVMGALGSTALYRLRKTWDLIPKATRAEYEALNTLISPDKNFGALRNRTETASLPMIPYMGTLMGDLLFIHQGNETLIDGLLNFSKLRQITNVVRRLRHAQSLSYPFERAPNVTQALQNLDSYKSEDVAFKRSLALEPRQ